MSSRRYIVMLAAVLVPLASWGADVDVVRKDNAPKMVVSFAGVDLSSPKGVDVLYGRIRNAAEVVCRVDQSRETQRIGRSQACFRSAVDDAVAQVNRPMLSQLHARRMGEEAALARTASR